MDVVALAQYGIDFAVATLGTAVGTTHLEKAFRQTAEIVFCFDGDEAGRRAAWRAMEVALPVANDQRKLRFLFLPQGEDPDTFVRSRGKEEFLTRVQLAQPMSEFFFDHMAEGLDLETLEDRATLAARAVPLLAQIPQGIFRQQMLDRLAMHTASDSSTIANLVGNIPAGRGDTVPVSQNNEAAPLPPRQRSAVPAKRTDISLIESISQLLLHHPRLVSEFGEMDLSGNPEEELAKLASLVSLVRQYPDASVNRLMGLWHSNYGTEGGEWLYTIAARERLIEDDKAAQAQLQEAIGRLGEILHRHEPSGKLIDKANSGAALSREELQELNRLLVEERRKDH